MAESREDQDDADQPLEWLAEPVGLLRHDRVDGDPCALRIFYDLVGDHPPGGSVSEVRVVESHDRVAVTVIRRALVGTGPDGSAHGYKLIGCLSCLELRLRWELEDRRVIDGATGNAVPQLDRAPDFDPEQGDLDHALDELLRTDGCPLWR